MNKASRILLIEDNEGDIELIIEAFKNYRVDVNIQVVKNGEQAIEFLSAGEKNVTQQRPSLIFLDINLPRVDEKEVLHYIKNDEELKTIPIVMLNSSSLQEDIQYSYSNQATCYIVKPENFGEFISVIHHIESFWLDCVTYPNVN
jgi:CheY-like chemotaxis protein